MPEVVAAVQPAGRLCLLQISQSLPAISLDMPILLAVETFIVFVGILVTLGAFAFAAAGVFVLAMPFPWLPFLILWEVHQSP